MKVKKDIFSFVNLFLFLAYLGISFFVSYAGDPGFTASLYSGKHVVSQHPSSIDDVSQQVSENNETDKDDDFELSPLKIPFLLSFLQLEILRTPSYFISTQALIEKPSNPIYLSICNFRV